MKKRVTFLYVLLFFVALSACKTEPGPDEVFQQAKQKIQEPNYLSFDFTMTWENPLMDEVTVTEMSMELEKFANDLYDYNYIGKREGYELVYQNDLLLQVNHSDKTVKVVDDPDQLNSASKNTFLSFSPLDLFKKEEWTFKSDTTIDNKFYFNFFQVEMDTLIDKKKVLLENHLFINPSNSHIDKYERRLYHDGQHQQFIGVTYSDYSFSEQGKMEEYIPPKGYVSKLESKKEQVFLLEAGKQAPDFELIDQNMNKVRLSDFLGKKVLIDFSMIRCGWCKIALDKFNDPDFKFKKDLQVLYINPVDGASDMDKYLVKNKIPFPILLNAAEVGKSYGVSGYPSFFLIDEKGEIEFSGAGFADEMIPLISN